MLGHILGGIATSLLFSSFESWLVAEHFNRGFDPQWLSLRFSKATFLENGLVAIMSRLFANTHADTLGFGPFSPFDVVACFLAIDPLERKNLLTQFKGVALTIASYDTILHF
ncbi:hypothetical protein SUGI_0212370 [Cryptomeria japonica]|nr:hypothetical protein SUGI_0212370 [Cryptomeria japonica]